MSTRARVFLAALILFLSSVTAAQAVLVARGPFDPANGFPTYYQDANGLALAPCLDPVNCGAEPDPFFNPLNPLVFPTNFPGEFFYWSATADPLSLPATTPVKVVTFGLQGTFLTLDGSPAVGQQTVISSIIIRIKPDVLVPGATYTVTHPFGVSTVSSAHLRGNGEYRLIEEIPVELATPVQDFDSVLNGTIGPFLTRVGGPIAVGTDLYIGNGVTGEPVTGSPTGNNFVRIQGPDVGGPGINTVETNLFLVVGKVFIPPVAALTVERATFERNATGGTVSVFAHANATAAVTFQGSPNLPPGPQPMTADASGQFFGQVALTPDATILPDPPTITVTAVEGAAVPPLTATLTVPLTDLVTISSAIFDQTTNTLTVQASSSDNGTAVVAPAVLTAAGLGGLVNGVGSFNVTAVPGSVTVTSSSGGQAKAPVIVPVGGVVPPAPVAANDVATTTFGTPVQIDVLANDTGPFNLADSVAVSGGPVAGSAVVDLATGIVTYSPNVGFTGTDIFNYTVTGPGGLSNVAAVTVTVNPGVTNEVLTIIKALYNARKNRWDIQGTSTALSVPGAPNFITVKLGGATGQQIGQPAAVPRGILAGGAWGVSARGLAVVPTPGATITVTSSFGTTVTVPVTIR